MTELSIADCADRLQNAHDNRVAIEPLSGKVSGADLEFAYKVQAELTRRSLAKGRRMVGRKIGLTNPVVQKQLGVDQPDYGVLFADMAFADGAQVQSDQVMQPRLEAEVALVLGRPLAGGPFTMADLIQAVDYVLPAIEIVGSRIADWKITVFDTIADNASSGMFVLGNTPRRLEGLDLRLCGMRMDCDGEPISVGAGAACLGHPLVAALWLANKMDQLGQPLEAGSVLMTGALGPMVPITPGKTYEARISGLGAVRVSFGDLP
jgi:2-keto-4-pentenoate hydratase